MALVHADDSARWYVVQTKSKQEARAAANLNRWGLETLAPKVREVQYGRLSGETYHLTAALFPSYIFSRFNAAALLTKVRLTRGVHSVIGFGECATPVDDSIIELIRGRMDENGFVRIEEPHPGDVVEIAAGPLRSLLGVFQRKRGHDRAVILFTAMTTQMRVEVPMTYLRRLAGGASW